MRVGICMIVKNSVRQSPAPLLQVVLGLAMLCASACGGAPMGLDGEMEGMSDTAAAGIVAQQAQPPLLSNEWLVSPTCAEDEFACVGTCANLNIDSNNCGGCGNVCEVGKHCQSGECVTECPP